MRIAVNDKINVIEIWTTKAERGGAEFNQKISEISDKITNVSGKKFKTVIFESGSDDLQTYTAALVKNNLTPFA